VVEVAGLSGHCDFFEQQFKYEWEKQYLAMTEDYIFPNTFKTLRGYCQYFNESDTRPELEIYDLGMINNVAFMLERGFLKKPVYLQFVLGILGAAPATLENSCSSTGPPGTPSVILPGRSVPPAATRSTCAPLLC